MVHIIIFYTKDIISQCDKTHKKIKNKAPIFKSTERIFDTLKRFILFEVLFQQRSNDLKRRVDT